MVVIGFKYENIIKILKIKSLLPMQRAFHFDPFYNIQSPNSVKLFPSKHYP